MAIEFPAIDPILFEVGPLAIRWYALSYVIGIIAGWYYLAFIDKRTYPHLLNKKSFDDILTYAILGVVLGGRLGYVIFYNLDYYLKNPVDIVMIWHGGMSFHGGMIGVIFAIWLFSRKYHIKFWQMIDLVACVTPIGLCLGRIANFINAELYGRTTDVAWGVIFPGTDGNPRHPSQLYEAFGEGILLFIFLNILLFKTNIRKYPGRLSGCFLIGYGVARIGAEFFREPDIQIGFIMNYLTQGMILSVPMMLFGWYLLARSNVRTSTASIRS